MRHSNLGGLGPDLTNTSHAERDLSACTARPDGTCPHEVYFENIGTTPNRDGGVSGISLVVRNLTEYVEEPGRFSGGTTNNDFGVIYIAGWSEVTVRFEFVHNETGEPLVLDSFFWSFYDIDHPLFAPTETQSCAESVELSGWDKVWFSDVLGIEPQIEVMRSEGPDGHVLLAQSVIYGDFEDNPKFWDGSGSEVDPDIPLSKGFAVLYSERSSFDVRALAG